ncbi:hypothetical protein SDRG_00535 [Saprolegnia diclina VS20]|uniref:Cytochrome b5 heme-binding domain-containing protein n=1 Tax=Saprolegnia diclina (strain VS20) TaxID=1156394 RepID=T0R8L3_SAPDV|nr:hypothetical protein SDRG_00535 [Saprolegnia diclina VS20]EQC42815.1 hypothetical protein SDRG_00535 [Saprolegnia diclina VS20]|eukprot:XP_008604238.1 hypothetical protein SDRG_00535 [Saprolegnia diclina VS20]
MPWAANNNQAGELRLPSHAAFLKSQGAPAPSQTFRAQLYRHSTPFAVYLHPSHAPAEATDVLFVHPRTHAQFVAQARFLADVPLDAIWCSDEQLINFELCDDQVDTWRWYNASKDPIAASISLEIRPLYKAASSPEAIDVASVIDAFLSASAGKIVTENERVVLTLGANDYFLRVLDMDADDPDETEFSMPNVFRAKVATVTSVLLTKENPSDASYTLVNDIRTTHVAPITAKGEVVDVWTSDDEMFPVKKKLLWPCIKLTSAVMAGFGVHKDKESVVHVDVDCCTFDRVLLYLEHSVLYPDEPFQFDPNVTDSLLQAAISIGCQGLEDLCRMRMGEFSSRVRKQAIPYALVVEKNAGNDTWLIMDGMVLDITRWLPEHPGGSHLIPAEALNIDCVGMFEIYHASKAAFRYLKQFYIGELDAKERADVPSGHSNPRIPLPSQGFLDLLAQYTKWRIEPEAITHISF